MLINSNTDDPGSGDPNQGGQTDTGTHNQENTPNQAANQIDTDAIKNEAVKGLLSDLGVQSADDLKAIIAAKNKADEANKSELEKAQSNFEKVSADYEGANKTIAQLSAENSALKVGITSDHVGDAVILAQAYVDNGTAKDMEKAIKTVLKNNPGFAGNQQTNPDGTAIIGNNINNSGANKVTEDEFSKMGYKERVKLYTEQPELYRQLAHK